MSSGEGMKRSQECAGGDVCNNEKTFAGSPSSLQVSRTVSDEIGGYIGIDDERFFAECDTTASSDAEEMRERSDVIAVDGGLKPIYGNTKAEFIVNSSSVDDLLRPLTSEEGVVTNFDLDDERVFPKRLVEMIRKDRQRSQCVFRTYYTSLIGRQ